MSAQELLAEVAAIAVAPGSITARGEALLAPLHRVLPFDAARIHLLDPDRRHLPCLVAHGYDDRVRQYLDGPEIIHNVEMLGLHYDMAPIRISKDLPVPAAELPVWAQHLHPAGLGEGIAVPLFTPDGRYLGVFTAETQSSTPISDAVRRLLGHVGPLIAHAVDPMRAITTLASLVSDTVAGVVLTRDGTTQAMPGLPSHRLLAAGSPVLAEAAACYADGHSHAAFLTVEQARDDGRGYLKVTVLACPTGPPGHLKAVVLLTEPGDLHGLTHQDLRLLGMLIADWPHPRITAHLRLARHALITTVDAIRTKLAGPTRDAAVIRAARQGLYLPPARPHR